jgi:nicotinamide riboside kinase
MKIGLCGTMSVGKTTLVNALKELPEFKDYTFRTERSKYLRDMGIPLNTDSTVKGQIVFAAERAAELMQENIITDRTIIDVIAFSKLSKSMESHEKSQLNGVLWNLIKDYDVIFYVSPKGVEMEDNGVRETDLKYRNTVDQTIQSIIRMNRPLMKNFSRLQGTTEERIEQIKDTLASL